MRQNIRNCKAIFPMPVLLIATYNDDETVNCMNAAWGTMVENDIVALNLSAGHKTFANIRKRKALTIHFATADHLIEADYFGIVSGHKVKDKLKKAGLSAVKSAFVDAPIINEYPLCLECEFIEFQDNQYGLGVIAKVVNTSADETIIENGQLVIEKMQAVAFDSYTNGYYQIGKRVGEAFREGKKLEK